VLYACPEFASIAELNNAYGRRNVESNTAFWKPSDIGPLPDGRDHVIVFKPGASVGYFHSDPVELTRARPRWERPRPDDRTNALTWRDLAASMVGAVGLSDLPVPQWVSETVNEPDALNHNTVATLAAALFEAAVVVV
jgi:hypothetical protein